MSLNLETEKLHKKGEKPRPKFVIYTDRQPLFKHDDFKSYAAYLWGCA